MSETTNKAADPGLPLNEPPVSQVPPARLASEPAASPPRFAATVPPPPAILTPGAPPAPPRKGGNGCLIGTLVLLGLGLVGVLGLIGLGIGVAAVSRNFSSAGSPRVHEEHLSGSVFASEKIAVIDVKGVITGDHLYDGASSSIICEALRAAQADTAVRAVILDMDTPGGEVTASDEIHHAVQQVRAAGKPVVTCMHAMGASGGYFVAAGTDYIIASRFTFTGSVGVIVPGFNYTGLFDKLGLKMEAYKSGEMKDMLSGSRARTQKEIDYVNHMVHETFLEFAKIVAEGRPGAFAGSTDRVLSQEFADGRVLSGADAHRLKLVDQLGYFDDAVGVARSMGNAPQAKIVRFRRFPGLADLLFSVQASLPMRMALPMPSAWARLKPGQPYYLMPEYLP